MKDFPSKLTPQNITNFLKSHLSKILYEKYPEHKNWVDVSLKTFSSILGIIISLLLVKVVSAFNCALQGSEGVQ
jgi:hypothetical protein